MMMKCHKITAFVLSALLFAGAPGAAVASDADIIRQAEDRVQIEALMWNYVRAIDSFNADAYVSVFTPDGAFGATKGSDALRKMVVDLKKSQEDRRAQGQTILAMHHIMSNASIEFVDKDHARYRYYWMTVFGGPAGVEPAPRVAAVGRGVDDVVRVGGKWLIQTRNVAPKD
ncbi:MAG TPA: nuclear transport factor 2 family protein [Sphingobium sp.]|nr:nuclear transport factor 2 family protein [Sphingobium sp.]